MAPHRDAATKLAMQADPDARELLAKQINESARKAAIRAGVVWAFIGVIVVGAAFWYANYLSAQRANDRIAEEHRTVQAQRDGCERTNEGVRAPMYDFFSDAIHARRQASLHADNQQDRQTDLEAVRNYQEDRQAMIDAAAPVALRPGSPLLDCRKAYPSPKIGDG